jgi:threonine synthase
MQMNTIYYCSRCRMPYPNTGFPYKCPNCGGFFEISEIKNLQLGKQNNNLAGIWKYRSTFGLNETAPMTYLGEGNTPLVDRVVNGCKVYYKLESLNPTGSFKDRGTAVLISMLKARGISEAIEDSSGNAGASFAAYSSAFDLKASIYIPDSTSGPKREQIETYGANVIPIPGPRENAAKAVLEVIKTQNKTYASHAYQPFGLAGMATIAYELVEQMQPEPKNILVPVGHGSLMLGLMLGFEALYQARLIFQRPRFIGVQPAAYAPLVSLCKHQTYNPSNTPTVAEGTKINMPVRGDAIFARLTEKDMFLAVSEAEIIEAYHQLSHMGLFVEPTSALVQAGFSKLAGQLDHPTVLILTGFGLKSDIRI